MSDRGSREIRMSTVQSEKLGDGVVRLTLNRPSALNTLNAELVAHFTAALDAIERDDSCHIVILTGAGRAFCAGLDLNGYGDDDLVADQGRIRRFLTRQSEI